MKKYFLCLLVVIISGSIVFAGDPGNWQIKKSTHFIVYYKNAPEDFIDKATQKSEDYYNRIAENLGFNRFDFWLWDNRAKIYIYDDAIDYQVSTGQPTWSGGYAIIRNKTIYTFAHAQDFFDTVLPHEMAHIVFREFVGFDNYAIPVWLDEGVASYQESSRYIAARVLIKEAMRQEKFISLAGLSKLSPQLIRDPDLVNLFYAEAVSTVDYLIKEFGRDKFVFFCQNLRDRKNLESAIRSTYPFNNIQELDEAWQKYLKNA